MKINKTIQPFLCTSSIFQLAINSDIWIVNFKFKGFMGQSITNNITMLTNIVFILNICYIACNLDLRLIVNAKSN